MSGSFLVKHKPTWKQELDKEKSGAAASYLVINIREKITYIPNKCKQSLSFSYISEAIFFAALDPFVVINLFLDRGNTYLGKGRS